jgi:uncharacterized protein (TIGR03435 family)
VATFRILNAFAFISAVALGQSKFEVASIRTNLTQGRMTAEFPPGGERFIATHASLRQLIVIAYGITPRQLSEVVPVSEEKYDVQAKADGPASRKQMQEMLQLLLIERFQLRLRREKREAPVYALVIEKRGEKGGSKLKPADEDSSWMLSRILGDEQPSGRIVFNCESMADFAFALSTLSRIGRIVVDETGLAGNYNFELNPALPTGPADEPIFTALREQLGLRLEPRRAPVEFLVIEHVAPLTTN